MENHKQIAKWRPGEGLAEKLLTVKENKLRKVAGNKIKKITAKKDNHPRVKGTKRRGAHSTRSGKTKGRGISTEWE